MAGVFRHRARTHKRSVLPLLFSKAAGGGAIEMIKVNGVWKTAASKKILVGGSWKEIVGCKILVGGVWK